MKIIQKSRVEMLQRALAINLDSFLRNCQTAMELHDQGETCTTLIERAHVSLIQAHQIEDILFMLDIPIPEHETDAYDLVKVFADVQDYVNSTF